MIRLDNISKQHGHQILYIDASMGLLKGEKAGLVGPNGAGKSTLINILAGLVRKSGGRAAIWGHDIDTDPRRARAAIGVVPQELNLDPFFTPREAMEFQAGLYGVPKAERQTDAILAAVGLTDKAVPMPAPSRAACGAACWWPRR